MNIKAYIPLLVFIFFIHDLYSQNKTKNELWINSSLTSEVFKVTTVKLGNLENRNRIGASIGFEIRSYMNETFILSYGLQIKSFRKSFILNSSEVFIEDLNLHFPLLLNYNLKLAKKHFFNFKMGLNGVLQTYQSATFSNLDYNIAVYRNLGFYPDLKFGFGYKFLNKKSIEVNFMYNMGFFEKNTEIIEYIPLESIVKTSTNGSFVEIELQYRLHNRYNVK